MKRDAFPEFEKTKQDTEKLQEDKNKQLNGMSFKKMVPDLEANPEHLYAQAVFSIFQ